MSAHDSSESPPETHEQDDGTEQPVKRPKRSRACQACRSMKIRCLPVEGQEACKACAKVNRACVMPGPARKRQKTVHKVAELEKKIDALTASLVAKNNASNAPAPTPPTDSPATTSTPSTKFQPPATRPEKEYSWDAVVEYHYPDLPGTNKGQPDPTEQDTATDNYEDIITRNVMDESTAIRVFQFWKTNMCPFCPIVAYPDDVTLDWMRKKRPMTLLAIIVAASGILVPDLQPDLAVEAARQFADRVMFYNEKSMDLIHAMMVYSTWYGKHKFARDLGFNHYIHSAVAMGLDLGAGKRSRQKTLSDAEDIELRRTWMGCYFMAGNVATVLRLPPLVKFSPYLEECLEAVESHPAALPTDGFLCCLVKLMHLFQDVAVVFHMDDPGSTIPLNDSRTQFHLKLFERQLEEWKTSASKYLPDAIMAQYDAVVSLYIHEIALHSEHNVDDFRPMYRTTGRETAAVTKDFLTNAHFEALTICVDSMHRAMSAFLDMDKDILRGAPAMHVVWTAYVAVAMIRLHGVLAVPDSKYASIFLPKLNVGWFLDACVAKLSAVVSDNVHVPAENFVVAFRKLRAWHAHRTMQQQQQQQQQGMDHSDKPNEGFSKGYGSSNMMPMCSPPNPDNPSSRVNNSKSSISSQGSVHISQPQLPPIPSYSYGRSGQIFPSQPSQQFDQAQTAPGSMLLDPNASIDASTFDIQNWDFSIGELNNFENYIGEAGWMGLLV